MGSLAIYRSQLERTLAETAGAHGVPGAVVGVLLDDDIEVAAWGVTSSATGIEVTPETLFQIGSLTKIYTATLLSQVVGAGVIGLDEPVRAQLQEFAVADPAATIEITPRHLLAHTCGIHGDHLIDTGWNPDALERYVATLFGLGQIHAPDETYSFCNTGFGVVGRLIEIATGEHFDRALRRRLTRPLGASDTLTLPQHALGHRVAVGHEQVPGSKPTPIRRWPLTRSNGPMGGILAPAAEVLAFARLHVAGGHALNGTELLPATAIDAMAQPQIESPLPDEDQALGWTVRRWNGLTCLGQDGDTFGQRSYLRVVPERRFALVLLVNSPMGALVAHDLVPTVAGELLEVTVAPGAETGAVVRLDDPERYLATYERLHQRIDVVADPAGGLQLRVEPSGILQQLGRAPAQVPLVAVHPSAGLFRATLPDTGLDEVVVFTPPLDGQPTAVYLQGRLHVRHP